jgi:hypothetical protein
LEKLQLLLEGGWGIILKTFHQSFPGIAGHRGCAGAGGLFFSSRGSGNGNGIALSAMGHPACMENTKEGAGEVILMMDTIPSLNQHEPFEYALGRLLIRVTIIA